MANKLEPIGKSSLGMTENVAALLAYLFSLVGGLVFFFVEKESKFVKFHAMQSAIMGGAWVILWVLNFIIAFIPVINVLYGIIMFLVGLGYFVISIVLLIKSYQGEWFELPIIGKIAMEQANK